MGEASDLTGLAPHVLRSWEKIYSQLSPKKNSAGNRVYRDQDMKLIFRIKELTQEQNYTIQGVKKALNGEVPDEKGPEVPAAVKKDLTEMKVFLEQLLEKL